MSFHSLARVAASVAVLALVSACATQPRVSSQVESSDYRSQARRTYAAPGPASDPWGPYITEASAKYDVPERWVREVMRQESGGRMYGRGGDLITSGAGAMGLMQVMPATYDDLRRRYSELTQDPFDPHNNILAGTAYIREMYDIYGAPGFLAAYNAGPGRLDDYLTRNRTLPEETRRYVASIGPRIAGSEPRTPSPGAQYAMNSLPLSIPDGPRYAAASRYSAPAAPIQLAAAAPRYSPPAAPIQLAAATPSAPYIVLNRPQPTQLAEPIRLMPQPTYAATRPAPYQAPVQVAALPEPPRPTFSTPSFAPASAPAPRQFAQLPEPPRAPIAPPRSQQMLASAALVPVAPARSGFSLVSQANAEPIGLHRGGGGPGNWAIQVGAFANEGLAASAAAAARDGAREYAGSARSSVSGVRQPHGTLYRARLTGMSHDAAAQACERLARSRTSCIVVSPEAQS